jgi:beta-ribofuranosylaminobenzene 5'-phosphate synthase
VTRVTAPSRLHFGLLGLPAAGRDRWPGLDGNPGQPVRHFGGVGLMVDRPGLVVRVEPANEWSAAGPLAERALGFARRVVDSLPVGERRPFRVEVQSAPAEHTGLGVGTQLGLAVARGLAVELGHDWPAAELATRVGRGERSAIGVHGFALGGLIVEGGKRPGEAVSPLVGRYPFPDDWAVVLVTPPDPADWYGGRERQAFARLNDLGPGPAETDALCRLVLTGILPALVSHDLDAFGEALHEFNARVGDVFAPAQGGRYASPAVADVVARLRARGVRGVGQSSWGPTVFAIVKRPEAEALAQELAPATIAGASSGADTSEADTRHET